MPSAEDQRTLQAWAERVDAAAREANARWGMDRLEVLVGPDLLAKFWRQQDRYRAALETAWASSMLTRDQLDAVTKTSGAMMRGWEALEAGASAGGHRPIVADVWEVRLKDGTVGAFVRTNDDAGKVLADGRHVVVWTLQEVANVIDLLPEAMRLAKAEFPGSKVQSPIAFDKTWVRHGDPLPEFA